MMVICGEGYGMIIVYRAHTKIIMLPREMFTPHVTMIFTIHNEFDYYYIIDYGYVIHIQ